MWRMWIGFVISICFVSYYTDVYAIDDKGFRAHTIIIIIPYFSFEEAAFFVDKNDRLIHEAALGAMNVRPAGPYSYLNNIVSISAGKRAVGVAHWNSYEKDEHFNDIPIQHWMSQTIGKVAKNTLYHPYAHRLLQKGASDSVFVGRFGQMLHDQQISRVVYGHSDTSIDDVRYGSLLLMDEAGEVDGKLSAAVAKNDAAPYRLEMDIAYLLAQLKKSNNKPHVTTIEWGDFYRLFTQKEYMTDIQFNKMYERQLERLHYFVKRTFLEVKPEHMWVIAPMMHNEAYKKKKQLAPLFYWGKGKGFLTSKTTKRPFLVSNIDFIPSLLDSYHVYDANEWEGNPIVRTKMPHVSNAEFLEKIDEMFFIYKNRSTVLSVYVLFLAVSLIVACAINFIPQVQDGWRYIVRLLLIFALWSPFWFLLLAKSVMTLKVTGFIILLIIASLICSMIVLTMTSKPIFWTSVCTFILITIDLYLQSPFMQRSFLGYDPIIGARYYGIGNEYAGIYIILAFACFFPLLKLPYKKVVMVSGLLLLIFLGFTLGKDTVGTNAGAMVSATIACAFLLVRYRDGFSTWRSEFILLSCSFFGALILLYFLQISGYETHISKGFQHLLHGDFTYIKEIIVRKYTMNIKLFKHSYWSQLLVISYVVGALLLWKRQAKLKEKEKRLFLQTGVVASFALLFLNDSGVVAAATSMFCIVSIYAYWVITQVDREKELTL